MKHLDLIETLSGELKPVVPTQSALRWSSQWLAIAILGIVLLVFGKLGLRPGIGGSGLDVFYAAKLFLLLAVATSSIAFAYSLSLPGRGAVSSLLRYSPGFFGALFLCLLFVSAIPHGLIPSVAEAVNNGGSACTNAVLVISLIPSIVSMFLVRRLAPLYPLKVAGLLGIASGCVGAIAIGLHCPSNEPMHWLVWHICPVLIISATCSLLGAKLLRW